jgi:hypothetical protein
MKRLPSEFYREIDALRSAMGESEYNRDQILPAVIGLIEKHRTDTKTHLLRDAANAILDNIEAAEDKQRQPGLFAYDAQVALGDRQRIKRGRMDRDQHLRRKRVIDQNKIAQDQAWAEETNWINRGIDALEKLPTGTVREAAISEEGKSAFASATLAPV